MFNNEEKRNKVHAHHVTTHFSCNVSKLVSKKVIFPRVVLALDSGILPIPFSANYPDQFAGIAVKAEVPAPPSHQAPPLAARGDIQPAERCNLSVAWSTSSKRLDHLNHLSWLFSMWSSSSDLYQQSRFCSQLATVGERCSVHGPVHQHRLVLQPYHLYHTWICGHMWPHFSFTKWTSCVKAYWMCYPPTSVFNSLF